MEHLVVAFSETVHPSSSTVTSSHASVSLLSPYGFLPLPLSRPSDAFPLKRAGEILAVETAAGIQKTATKP